MPLCRVVQSCCALAKASPFTAPQFQQSTGINTNESGKASVCTANSHSSDSSGTASMPSVSSTSASSSLGDGGHTVQKSTLRIQVQGEGNSSNMSLCVRSSRAGSGGTKQVAPCRGEHAGSLSCAGGRGTLTRAPPLQPVPAVLTLHNIVIHR